VNASVQTDDVAAASSNRGGPRPTGAVGGLLRREHVFLRRALNLRSRLLLLLAAITVATAIFLPLWQITLVAPQYQEGLRLHIYAYKLVGGNGGQDIFEINTLNHYIGMHLIEESDFVEMKWMPFAFGIFALLALRAAAVGKIISLVDLTVLFLYFGAFALGNFAYRLYSYGHNLDAHAPIHIPGFTPVLLGSRQIANFVETSLPHSGAALLGLFPLLVLTAIWCSRKEEP
jgi:copper chaperone NosL